MKKLYAPWREEYTTEVARTKNEPATEDTCTFCTRLKENNDKENFILKRTSDCAIFLNRYPYNAGHLLILPNAHIAELETVSTQSHAHIMELITQAIRILKNKLRAEGINVGLNLGRAAGAGIPSHLHFHVLPRWIGDTNFLPALAETKQISADLNQMYDRLHKAFGTPT